MKRQSYYLIHEKGFNLTFSKIVYKQQINGYQKIKGAIDESVTMHQWEDNRRTIPSVYYDVKPRSYANTLIKDAGGATRNAKLKMNHPQVIYHTLPLQKGEIKRG